MRKNDRGGAAWLSQSREAYRLVVEQALKGLLIVELSSVARLMKSSMRGLQRKRELSAQCKKLCKGRDQRSTYHHEKLVILELKPEANVNSSELAQVLEMMIA
jgi:hypothetical protein